MSVNLSDAQKTQIRQIMASARAEAKTQDPETRRKTLHDAFEKVQAVMTPAQRTAFNAKLAELRAQSPVQAPTP
jgi:Spy/CpxP family protein refolding chaperone